ncbi:MAG: carboxymuconolactone decarboxylase family protein [Nitrospiraceae bacterium]
MLGVTGGEAAIAHDISQYIFTDIKRAFGIAFVPDLFRDMATRPAYLETAWELFKDDLALDVMDLKTKRIVALAISATHDGSYCISAYPYAFRGIGVEEALIDKILFAVQLFSSFNRFLQGIRDEHASGAVRVVNEHLRQGATRMSATMPSQHSRPGHGEKPAASWAEKMIVMTLLILIVAVGVFLFLL